MKTEQLSFGICLNINPYSQQLQSRIAEDLAVALQRMMDQSLQDGEMVSLRLMKHQEEYYGRSHKLIEAQSQVYIVMRITF